MDLTEALKTTRAMRRLTNDPPVTDEEITTCLEAAIQAPSGGNVQPWHFVVLTNQQARDDIAAIYQRAIDRYLAAMVPTLPAFRSPEDEASFMRGVNLTRHLADHLAETPIVVFVMATYENTLADDEGTLDIGTVHASVFPAVQNFMLAARGLGLGTTLTTAIRIYHDEAKQLLGLKPHHEIAALVPIGRPVGSFGVAPRKPVEAVTSWNQYGNRRSS